MAVYTGFYIDIYAYKCDLHIYIHAFIYIYTYNIYTYIYLYTCPGLVTMQKERHQVRRCVVIDSEYAIVNKYYIHTYIWIWI